MERDELQISSISSIFLDILDILNFQGASEKGIHYAEMERFLREHNSHGGYALVPYFFDGKFAAILLECDPFEIIDGQICPTLLNNPGKKYVVYG